MKTTKSLKALLVLAGVLFLLFYPISSKADTITVPSTEPTWKGLIMSDHMDGTGGAGTAKPYGIVELWQIDTNTVDVRVTLYDSNKFVSTGSGNNQDFLFNMTGGLGVVNITVNTSTSTNYPYPLLASAGLFSADGLGPMGFGITGDGQPNGLVGGFTYPIIYQVNSASGVTIAQLTTPNPIVGGKGGNIFGVDMWSGQTTNTGLVDVTLQTVPEPGILILLGIAMSAIGAASYRIRKL